MKQRFRMYVDYAEAKELLRRRAVDVNGLAHDLLRLRDVRATYKRLKHEMKYLDYYAKHVMRMREERKNG